MDVYVILTLYDIIAPSQRIFLQVSNSINDKRLSASAQSQAHTPHIKQKPFVNIILYVPIIVYWKAFRRNIFFERFCWFRVLQLMCLSISTLRFGLYCCSVPTKPQQFLSKDEISLEGRGKNSCCLVIPSTFWMNMLTKTQNDSLIFHMPLCADHQLIT